ncbi:hypothetical protein RB195_005812 [Necator americanus]|uniref:CUB domain-containing protein n=1 Tax=Necator americanus TaxID=51031 RepID=A0ABR1BPN7_NECAM
MAPLDADNICAVFKCMDSMRAITKCIQFRMAVLADDVPLCGNGIFELLDASNGFPAPPQKRDHVAVVANVGDRISVRIFENDTSYFPPVRCSLRIETCPNCLLNIKHTPPVDILDESEIRMLPACYESLLDPCFDLRFIEDKADSALDLIYQKSSIWEFPHRSELNSTGNSIVLTINMWSIQPNTTLSKYIDNLFPFFITAVSNEVVITGSSTDSFLSPNQSSLGFIESPRYPAAYPRSLLKNYTLINSDQNGYIRLVFDDFHVHFQSEMQIFDSDGREIISTKSENRRPPAILSTGNRLKIQFNAHDFTQTVGFRARYEFVNDKEWADKPNSRDCDEILEGYGGEIKMDGNLHLINTYVDCIWIIGRFPHMARTFDRIYLKIEEFHMKGVGLRLEVREGASSTSDRLLLLFDSQTRDQLEHKQPRNGFTTTSSMPAFYVRLRGYLMGSSGLEIVYTQFYRWATALCPGAGEFHCDNARCIKGTLRCDGVNHCGDGSDEQCQRPISDFKQPDSDVSGLIALVIGVCGLILLIISTTAVMGRFYRRRIASQLSGADLSTGPNYPPEGAVPSMQTVGERRFYVVPESQISVIEAPPSYDDALKHPAVPTSRTPAYMNQGYMGGSASEENMIQSANSEAISASETDVDNTINVASEVDDRRNEMTSPQPISRLNEASQPGTSASSPNLRRKEDESWLRNSTRKWNVNTTAKLIITDHWAMSLPPDLERDPHFIATATTILRNQINDTQKEEIIRSSNSQGCRTPVLACGQTTLVEDSKLRYFSY